MLKFLELWFLRRLQKRIGVWQNKTFPESTKESVAAHLKSEAYELAESHDPSEGADVFLLAIAHANKAGYDLGKEALKKFEINQRRNWNKVDPAGFRKHSDE
jgi:NTP pyrophosphatase (non-canonical NTP hydrolase)